MMSGFYRSNTWTEGDSSLETSDDPVWYAYSLCVAQVLSRESIVVRQFEARVYLTSRV